VFGLKNDENPYAKYKVIDEENIALV